MPRTSTVQKPCDKPPKHVFVLTKHLADSTQDMSHTPIGNVWDDLTNTSPQAVIITLQGGKQSRDERAREFITNLTPDEILMRSVKVTYQQWSCEQILRHLLLSHVGVPTSFETISSLIHRNFLPEREPCIRLIVAVLVHKLSPRIRTVVNKTAATVGPFRVLALEVLEGERNTVWQSFYVRSLHSTSSLFRKSLFHLGELFQFITTRKSF